MEVHSAVLHIFWYSHLDPATVHENLHWRRLLRPCLGPRAPAARRLNANAARSSLLRFSSAQFKDMRFALQALGERASDARRSAGFFPLIAFKRRHRCPKHGPSSCHTGEEMMMPLWPPPNSGGACGFILSCFIRWVDGRSMLLISR